MRSFTSIALICFVFLGALPEDCHGEGPRARLASQPFRLRVVKGQVPTDENYLKFMEWHEQQSVVTAVVSGDDRNEVKSVMETAHSLKKRGVLLEAIVLIGTTNTDLFIPSENIQIPSKAEFAAILAKATGGKADLRAVPYEGFAAMMRKRKQEAEAASILGAGAPSMSDAAEVINKYQLRYSPAWIVRYRGTDYIYEGNVNLKQLFGTDGRFSGANDFVFSPSTRKVRPSGVKFKHAAAISAAHYKFPLPHGAGTYDGKPACEKSQVRRRPVLVDSEELKLFDMVVYDYRSPKQAAAADRWEFPTVPYLEGALVNPYQPAGPQQYWARFFDIQCLPTRIHYRMADGVKYEEYREGERAFDREY